MNGPSQSPHGISSSISDPYRYWMRLMVFGSGSKGQVLTILNTQCIDHFIHTSANIPCYSSARGSKGQLIKYMVNTQYLYQYIYHSTPSVPIGQVKHPDVADILRVCCSTQSTRLSQSVHLRAEAGCLLK